MKKLIVVLFVFLFMVSRLYAQWEPTGGPYGGNVGIASDGTNVYATVLGEIYISTDKGAHWTHPANKGLNNLTINAIVGVGSKIFAGTSPNSGLFVSSD